MTWLCAVITSLVVAATATPWVRRSAARFGWFDPIDARKVHTAPTPRLGGVAIGLGFFVAVGLTVGLRPALTHVLFGDLRLGAILAGALAMSLVGLFDDLRNSSPPHKLLLQCAIALALFAAGFRVSTLVLPWGSYALGWLSLPLTVFWIVGVTNAVNLIDGLDGLAAGVSLIAFGALFALGLWRHDSTVMLLSAAGFGAVLGFLFYNFNPASIFMGDTGSLFLGFLLAVLPIAGGDLSPAGASVRALFPLLLLALPLGDTTVAVVRRLLNGRPPFAGDREHFHHRLLGRGLSQRQAVLTLYVAALLCAVAALALFAAVDWGVKAAAVLGVLALLHVALDRLGYYRDFATRDRARPTSPPQLRLIRSDDPPAIPRPPALRAQPVEGWRRNRSAVD